jgi:hypothetical protein
MSWTQVNQTQLNSLKFQLTDLKDEQEPVLKMKRMETYCRTCSIEFKTETEAKRHFKSDFHHYNIKRSLLKQPAIDLDTWEELESLSSIENSCSSSSDSETNASNLNSSLQGSPFVMLELAPDSWSNDVTCDFDHQSLFCKIYKQVLFHSKMNPSSLNLLSCIHQLTLDFTWTMIMVSSGHFAACVITNTGKMLAHKTFHRYTTRRKQGGSQAANDNKGKSANSAGATLRRYNEQALKVNWII